MSVLEWTRDPVGQLKKYAELGQICFQDVGRFEECNQVWAAIGIMLGIVCILTPIYIARHFYREYSGYRRVRLRRLAEMEIADPEVMKEYVWSGEKVLDHGLSQQEVIQPSRKQKRNNAETRHRMTDLPEIPPSAPAAIIDNQVSADPSPAVAPIASSSSRRD
jgi:hypothetical protein